MALQTDLRRAASSCPSGNSYFSLARLFPLMLGGELVHQLSSKSDHVVTAELRAEKLMPSQFSRVLSWGDAQESC